MVAAQLEHGIGFVPTRATHRRAARELRRARKAAITPFLVLGVAFPTYFVRIPSLKLQLGLSNEAMGLLLTVPALAAVLAIPCWITAGKVTPIGRVPDDAPNDDTIPATTSATAAGVDGWGVGTR